MQAISETRWSRRQFMNRAAVAVIAAHGGLASAALGSESMSRAKEGAPRILVLRLACAAALAEMREFYHGQLGLPVLEEDARSLTIASGQTRLTFVAEPDLGAPFYHFAFNIPETKILPARKWQLRRTPLIPAPERLRDPRMPDDIIDYRHWNAHSIFFWDPAGNLVEYIARHDLDHGSSGEDSRFSHDDILYASEIGFVVDDVDTTAADLKKIFKLEQYRGGSDAFRATGDEHGLLLAMRRGRMMGFGEGKPAGVFPTRAKIGGVAAGYTPDGFPYEIFGA